MTGGGQGSLLMQALAQVKNITGAGSQPQPPPQVFSPAHPFAPMPPQQMYQKQQGPRPSNKPPTNMTVIIMRPETGNRERGHGKPIQQRQGMSKPLSVGSGAHVQHPRAPTYYGAKLDEYPDPDPDDGAMDNNFATEYANQAPMPLCIMCKHAPQREKDHFCGDGCKKNAMIKQ